MKYFDKKKQPKGEKICYYLVFSIIIFAWIAIVVLTFYSVFLCQGQWKNAQETKSPILAEILVCLNFVLIVFIYFSSVIDLIYYAAYFIYCRKRLKYKNEKMNNIQNIKVDNNEYKIYVLYCTKNDFDDESLSKSMKQTYKNCEYYILDDSTDEEYIKAINDFSTLNNVNIIRRDNNKGFKAGNINNFLSSNKNYDYFVVLDADEIIPNDFVEKSLKYFTHEEVGIVQAKNFCTRQKNIFDYLCTYLHNVQWQTEYNVRDSIGLMNLCGHGAIISKECYEKANGFPELILEDWSLTFISLSNNYVTVYANNIVCEEEFPNNYFAFKKRQYRWTQGGVELFKKYFIKFFFTTKKIPFFRKCDLLYRQTIFLINILSMFALVVNLSILIPIGFSFDITSFNSGYWIYVALMLFFPISHALKIFIFYVGKINIFKLIFLMFFSYFLYASLFLSSFVAIVSGLFAKKLSFFVTPKKKTRKISLFTAIKVNIWELVIAILLTTIMLIFILVLNVYVLAFIWAIFTIVPLYLSVFFSLLSNIEISKKQKLKILNENHNQKIYP